MQREKRRAHPLDIYQPLKERFRVGGCGILILLVIVVPILAVGIFGWFQYNRFVNDEGFESVFQEEANVGLSDETGVLTSARVEGIGRVFHGRGARVVPRNRRGCPLG